MAVYRLFPCPSSALGRSEWGMGVGMEFTMGFSMGFTMGLTYEEFRLLQLKTKIEEIQKNRHLTHKYRDKIDFLPKP